MFLLAFLLLALDSGSRVLAMQHNWHDPDFRSLLTAVIGMILLGVMLLIGASIVPRAKWVALAILALGNVLFLYSCWNGAKEAILVPPLMLSLGCLLFEETKLLTGMLLHKA